jgi:diguanylate cyclase (GGDEF)-like protein
LADFDRSLRDVSLLHESSQMILAGGDLDSVLHQILLIVRNYFATTSCAVFLVEEGGAELICKARNGYPEPRGRYRIGIDGVVGWAAKARQVVSVPDVKQESRYLQGNPSVQSELALPLLVRGELVGVLDVESDQLNYFSPDMVQVLSMFAGQAAIAVDNSRLFANERRRMRQIELINLIARSATSTSRTRDLLLTLCELISDTFENSDTAIFLVQPDSSLALQSHVGRKPEKQHFTSQQRLALLSDSSPRIHNPAIGALSQSPGCYGVRSREVTVPLVTCGQMLGLIVFAPPPDTELTEEDLFIAQAASDVCATAIKNVQLTEELNRVANTDLLTGIHNQRFFSTAVEFELTRARRYRKPAVLALVEVVGLRQVTEAAGFEGGDDYLRTLAHHIQAQIRTNDVLCRYAYDRFAFIFPETDSHQFAAIEKKLRSAISSVTYQDDGNRKSLDAIIASALFPTEGTTSAELLRLLITRAQHDRSKTTAASA